MIRPKGNFTPNHLFLLCGLFLIPLAMILVRITAAHPLSGSRLPSFGGIPPDVQVQMAEVLFLPLAALVITFVRLTLGIRLLGPFRSILLAIAFQVTGIVPGVLFLSLVIASIALIRPVLKRMCLTYFARVSTILGTVAGMTIAVVVAADALSIEGVENVAYFPMIALCLVAEAFARTLRKEGFRGAFWRVSTTSVLAMLIALLTQIPGLEVMLLQLPELVIIQIGCILAISEFFDLRLLELLNPAVAGAISTKDTTIRGSDLDPRQDSRCSQVEETPVADGNSLIIWEPEACVGLCAMPRFSRTTVRRASTAPKIAVVRNWESSGILYRFGRPCPERYGRNSVQRVLNAIRSHGLDVCVLEADLNLPLRLQEYFGLSSPTDSPSGMVFNMAYGLQGECRYTHVPALLEMAGVPYTGASPLGHAVSLDKVTAKFLMQEAGIPTPAFTVMVSGEEDLGALRFPLIVKARHESTSYGLHLVQDRTGLREAVLEVVGRFQQEALVEEYIDGREFCLALIGNDRPECLPIVELDFGGRNLRTMTWADKYHKRQDEPDKVCPAPVDPLFAERLRHLAIATFDACHCSDYARVDIRLDREGNPFVLEINSMASLGIRGSYVLSARVAGSEFDGLIRRILDVAYQRYFGEPLPFPQSTSLPLMSATSASA